VFKYKFDTKGYLIKYKVRLYVRDTYVATLVARTFRYLIAITAAFDLETRQYNAVNAFINSLIDEDTY
ncbi:uncharacterized protein K452DRAFT_196212, partial [Aplosporella prunicola CBS 121167]